MTHHQGTISGRRIGGRFHRIHCIFFTILMFVMAGQEAYATFILSSVCGSGSSNIPDATVDGLGATTPGVLSCGFTTNLSGTIGAGNAVTISLIGLRHEASGDLGVTLTHFTDATRTVVVGAPQVLFYRIGKVSNDPNDFGFAAQFGDPLGLGENYDFNSGNLSNLWTVAALLGSADFIPGQVAGFTAGYATNNAFSAAPNLFSSLFAAQVLAGYWQLEITDYAAGPSEIATEGSLLQWQLGIVDGTSIPEPGYAAIVSLLLLGIYSKRK